MNIESELRHYAPHFEGKTIHCDCGRIGEYFTDNFETLGLRRVIIVAEGLSYEHDGAADFFDVDESIDRADIVVSHPGSTTGLREVFELAVASGKDFILFGDHRVVTHGTFFPHFQSGFLRFGVTRVRHVRTGDRWFTNLDHGVAKGLDNAPEYDPDNYPRYDNFDAIEVAKIKNIPKDYHSLMGVPTTYMDLHDPNEFDIVGMNKKLTVQGQPMYDRLLIRRNR